MYPRPQLRRTNWQSLDGEWDFAFSDAWLPQTVKYGQQIQVPYTHETPRSGLGDQTAHGVVWYRQTFKLTEEQRPAGSDRLMLHFGAVDWQAQVWVNGQFAGQHSGGYTPFHFDVTDVVEDDSLTIEVRAADDASDMAQPRGKQDWLEKSHGIWYPRTTGIWQSVWLERVPAARIEALNWTPNLEHFSLELGVKVSAEAVGKHLRVKLSLRGQTITEDQYLIHDRHIRRTIALPDPGIDDARDDFLWSPEHPQLIDAQIEIVDGETVLDSVESYTALRSVGTQDGHFMLNGRPYYLRLALDQGYWTEGGLSASSDELRADVELSKKLGFNGVRKHQKIENPLWLEWCDRLGLLVWEELPSAYAFGPQTITQLTQTWTEAILRDQSHPCIVAWVPFNESWAVPDLPVRADQRHLVQSLYHLSKALDPSRPAVGNDGWEHVVGDLLTIHDYHSDPNVLLSRYGSADAVLDTLTSYRSAGRAITLPEFSYTDQPVILSEFGGIAYRADGTEGWGYSVAKDSDTFLKQYQQLMQSVYQCQALSGFCYTQLTDTYQEINGLLTMGREPKADLTALAAATRGKTVPSTNPLGYSPRWLSKEAQS